jgi:nitrous oxidase accessory protein
MSAFGMALLAAGIVRVDSVADGRGLAQALERAKAHDTVVMLGGTFQQTAPLVITKPLTLLGRPGSTLRGRGDHTLLIVRADSVTVRFLTFANVQRADTDDRAAVLLDSVSACLVADNVVVDAHFGIYAKRASDCTIANNRVRGSGSSEQLNGNAIHLWSSRDLLVKDNVVEGYRDGIYMEFVTNSQIVGNTSRANRRFGLHFMFSHDCAYRTNTFVGNGAGVAVMYTKRVEMRGNDFLRNQGPAAYGLLLKDITDSDIVGNTFRENSTALHMDGAARVEVRGNAFENNGWAVRLLANAVDTKLEGNTFIRNSFDLATNSRSSAATIRDNYWDGYTGYDLNGDGQGDVPHRPMRLFALVVEQTPLALALQGSFLATIIDYAERAFPVLTPSGLLDPTPRMQAAR